MPECENCDEWVSHQWVEKMGRDGVAHACPFCDRDGHAAKNASRLEWEESDNAQVGVHGPERADGTPPQRSDD